MATVKMHNNILGRCDERGGDVRVSGEFYIAFPGATQKSLKAADLESANPDNAASAQGLTLAGV